VSTSVEEGLVRHLYVQPLLSSPVYRGDQSRQHLDLVRQSLLIASQLEVVVVEAGSGMSVGRRVVERTGVGHSSAVDHSRTAGSVQDTVDIEGTGVAVVCNRVPRIEAGPRTPRPGPRQTSVS